MPSLTRYSTQVSFRERRAIRSSLHSRFNSFFCFPVGSTCLSHLTSFELMWQFYHIAVVVSPLRLPRAATFLCASPLFFFELLLASSEVIRSQHGVALSSLSWLASLRFSVFCLFSSSRTLHHTPLSHILSIHTTMCTHIRFKHAPSPIPPTKHSQTSHHTLVLCFLSRMHTQSHISISPHRHRYRFLS